MSLVLNVPNWWECSSDELWTMSLRRSNFVTQGDKCDHRDWSQTLLLNLVIKSIPKNFFSFDSINLSLAFYLN